MRLNKNRWSSFRDYVNFGSDVVSPKRKKMLMKANKAVIEKKEYLKLYEYFRRNGAMGIDKKPHIKKKYNRYRWLGKKYNLKYTIK